MKTDRQLLDENLEAIENAIIHVEKIESLFLMAYKLGHKDASHTFLSAIAFAEKEPHEDEGKDYYQGKETSQKRT